MVSFFGRGYCFWDHALHVVSENQRYIREPSALIDFQRLSERHDGLSGLYDPKQDYSRLLLVAGILLTIVGSRLIMSGPGPRASRRSSGIRQLAPSGSMPEAIPARTSVGKPR